MSRREPIGYGEAVRIDLLAPRSRTEVRSRRPLRKAAPEGRSRTKAVTHLSIGHVQ